MQTAQRRLVLCATTDFEHTELAAEVERQTKALKVEEIRFEAWGVSQLCTRLKQNARLVDDFFGRRWVELFCDADAAASLADRATSYACFRPNLQARLRDAGCRGPT